MNNVEIRALHPTSGAVIDPVEAISNEHRAARTDRPWVLTNMVASLDGGTAIDGVSGGLGGPADLAVFLALRAVVDLIIVGAGTAMAESYQPPRPSEEIVRMRTERGQAARPLIVVVTRSLSIEPSAPLFADPDYRPLLLTTEDAPADRIAALSSVADIAKVGQGQVDLQVGVSMLRQRGALALLEGGPTLNGQFIAADLVDEWNQTTSPMLLGGASRRPAVGRPETQPVHLELDRLWSGDGLLFGRWVRQS